jgi:hypothetical protein
MDTNKPVFRIASRNYPVFLIYRKNSEFFLRRYLFIYRDSAVYRKEGGFCFWLPAESFKFLFDLPYGLEHLIR